MHDNDGDAMKELLGAENEILRDLAKFAKIIMSKFSWKPKGPGKPEGPEVKKPCLSRSGREIIPPTRLNL